MSALATPCASDGARQMRSAVCPGCGRTCTIGFAVARGDSKCDACGAALEAFDAVNRPAHYTAGGIECIDAIRAALGDEAFVAHCRATAIKYAWRAGRKDKHAEDLRKGAWYLTRAAEVVEGAR